VFADVALTCTSLVCLLWSRNCPACLCLFSHIRDYTHAHTRTHTHTHSLTHTGPLDFLPAPAPPRSHFSFYQCTECNFVVCDSCCLVEERTGHRAPISLCGRCHKILCENCRPLLPPGENLSQCRDCPRQFCPDCAQNSTVVCYKTSCTFPGPPVFVSAALHLAVLFTKLIRGSCCCCLST
jgi:hypothetical protein